MNDGQRGDSPSGDSRDCDAVTVGSGPVGQEKQCSNSEPAVWRFMTSTLQSGYYEERFGMEALSERRRNDVGKFDVVPMVYVGEILLQQIEPSAEGTTLRRLMRDLANDLNPQGKGI